LATYLNLPPDHIHDNAETIEHIITPQVEQWLEQQLNYPKTDPHGETIPY
jgi:manganese/zinc/iron transport system permease protein